MATYLNRINDCAIEWKIKIDQIKSQQVTFILNTGKYPQMSYGNESIPQS